MPQIKLEIVTQYSQDEVFQKVSGFLESDTGLRKMDPDYSCEFNKEDYSGSISSRQFQASVKILAHGEGSRLEVTVKLPLHLAIFKGMIESKLKHKLQKLLC